MSDKAFVVMQIGGKDSAERKRADEVYNFIIGPALRKHGLEPIRADLDPTPGPITQKMLADLVSNRLVIVDLTGRNPNVFYELGIAHSFARPMIAIADSVKNLPFDAKDERVIEIGAYGESGLTYAQGEAAKASLEASLNVVLEDGYVAPSPLREVAGTQSLDALAPENPLASEIGQIKETLDEVHAYVRRPRFVSRAPAHVMHDVNLLRAFVEELVSEVQPSPARLTQLANSETTPEQDQWVADLIGNAGGTPVASGWGQQAGTPVASGWGQPANPSGGFGADPGTPDWAGSGDSTGHAQPSYEEPPF